MLNISEICVCVCVCVYVCMYLYAMYRFFLRLTVFEKLYEG